MLWYDTTLESPAENLALDEALLDEAEKGILGESLRIWESPTHFAVLGAGCRLREDVRMATCRAEGVAVFRRCSGGGTVLQGPGCLNYGVVLDRSRSPELDAPRSTAHYVLARTVEALAVVGLAGVVLEGIGDLVFDGMKIGGSAQKRKKRFVLFHATLLWRFDIPLLGRCLVEPARRPDYRGPRTHDQFVRNAPVDPVRMAEALRTAWGHPPAAKDWPVDAVFSLIRDKYSRDEFTSAL